MTSVPDPANNRPTAAIDSRSRAPSMPQHRVLLRPVHSGVSTRPAGSLACRRKGRRSRSSVRAHPSLRFGSRTRERKATPRFVSSAQAASAAKCSPVFHVSKGCDSMPSLPGARPFGLSRPDGRRRAEPGSIEKRESYTPKSIRASARLSATRSKTAARCGPCGIGRATSTPRIYSTRSSPSRRASRADRARITRSVARRAGSWVVRF